MALPRCQTCRFFVPGDGHLGECRVTPPTPSAFDWSRGRFPEVLVGDWCGRHQPIESSESAAFPWKLPAPSEN